MGLENLSVSSDFYDREGSIYGVLVKESREPSGPYDIRLVWSTMYGSDPNVEWVIEVSTNGRLKGQSLGQGWRSFSETFPAASCHETRPDGDAGRTWWSHDLNIGGMLAYVAGQTQAWNYSTRVFDGLAFEVSIRSNWKDGFVVDGMTGSETARLNFNVNYCPEYVLTSASYDASDTLVINYSTTWTRIDDRFNVRAADEYPQKVSTVEGVPLFTQQYWGTVAARGRIEIPGSLLTQIPAGKQIYLWVDFNAEFRPIELEFNHAAGTLTVEDSRSCSTPRIELLQSGETIRIRTSTLADEDVEPDSVVVRMVGSSYSVDSSTVGLGETAEFRYPPLGTQVSFEAVGVTQSGATSRLSNRLTFFNGGGTDSVLLDPVARPGRVRLRYRAEWDAMGPTVDVSPNVTTTRLAGRGAPSAYYGTGVSRTVSFTAWLIDDDGRDVEALSGMGDLMCRFPDGRRYCIAPSVKLDRKTSRFVSVTVSGEEVGG